MQEVITRLADVPFARMFVLAGIIFLMVAVLGKIEGKIDPGHMGRVGASILGIVLMVIGLVLQYFEIREAGLERAAQQGRIMAQSGFPAPAENAARLVAAPPASAAPPIKVVSGTYGRSCNGKAGNATQLLAKVCDGKSACDYAIEPVELEGAPANCARDFAAEWKCGTASTVYAASLPADAAKTEKLHLACAG